jgi:hypothetical protein
VSGVSCGLGTLEIRSVLSHRVPIDPDQVFDKPLKERTACKLVRPEWRLQLPKGNLASDVLAVPECLEELQQRIAATRETKDGKHVLLDRHQRGKEFSLLIERQLCGEAAGRIDVRLQ